MKKLFPILSVLLLAAACRDVIDVDTPNRDASIAVVGRITQDEGVKVKVSLTAGYFDQGATPVINDAIVQLLENDTVVATLSRDTLDGVYISNYNGSVGKTYSLRIEVPTGSASGFKASTWRSSPERLNRIFTLDSLNIRYLNRTTTPNVFQEGFYALAYFREPSGKGDVYRFRPSKNDTLAQQSAQTFDDEFVDGGYFGGGNSLLPAFTFSGPLDDGDTVSIEFSSISKDYQDYLALINEQVFRVGGPFAAPPAAVIGNIYNENNPDEFGFGYFVASATVEKGIAHNP